MKEDWIKIDSINDIPKDIVIEVAKFRQDGSIRNDAIVKYDDNYNGFIKNVKYEYTHLYIYWTPTHYRYLSEEELDFWRKYRKRPFDHQAYHAKQREKYLKRKSKY